MATNATRTVTVVYTGDVVGSESVTAGANANSPGQITVHALASGDNTITVPSVPGITVAGATIFPPVGNANNLTLKGVTADTGVPLHKTDPTSLGLGGQATFILNAGAAINGLRIFWS